MSGYVKVLFDGLVKIEGGWSVSEVDGQKYFCIDYIHLDEILNKVFMLSKRFSDGNGMGVYLRYLFKRYFIYDDELYCVPYPPPDINDVMKGWGKFMGREGIRYRDEIDCDDFARLFHEFLAFKYRWNLAGELWGVLVIEYEGKKDEGGHAFNWVIKPLGYNLEEGTAYIWVLIVEPQIEAFTTPDINGVGTIHLSNGELTYRPYIAFG